MLSFYTHYFLISVIALQVGLSLLFLTKKEKADFISQFKKYIIWTLPWIILLLFARPPVNKSFWIGTLSFKDMLLFPGILFTGYETSAGFIYKPLIFISIIVFLIIVFGVWALWQKERRHALSKEKLYRLLLVIGWSIAIPLSVFIFSFFKPIFLPRYLIFATVGLLLLLLLIIDKMHIRLKYILFVVLLIISVHYGEVQVALRTKAPVGKTFAEIKQLIRPNDVVYVLHEYDFHPAEYYINDSQVYIYKKSYAELPWFVGKVLIPQEKIASTLPQYPRRAFVLQPDGSSYSIQSLY